MKSLEEQLRSWKPRRPSPALERRLFPQRAAEYRSELLAWLVPATVCVAMVMMTSHQPENPAMAGETRESAMIPAAMSNQSYAPYLPGSFQSSANRLDTFEWTKAVNFTSSIGSLTPPKGTN